MCKIFHFSAASFEKEKKENNSHFNTNCVQYGYFFLEILFTPFWFCFPYCLSKIKTICKES